MEKELTNNIQNSKLVQVNLDDYYPQGERILFDIKPHLHNELVLFEKDFRKFVKENNWQIYENKYVGIICSNDAIVPMWAYMLIAANISPFAKKVIFGDKQDVEKAIFTEIIAQLDFTQYQDKNVIVKGCGKYPIPTAVFVHFFIKLQTYANKVMFGEACSAVPLFRKQKNCN